MRFNTAPDLDLVPAPSLEPVPNLAHLSMAVRPLRICQVVPYDLTERGGVAHHAFQLARILRERGDEVTVIGPASAPIDEPGVVGFKGVVNIPMNGSHNRMGLFIAPWKVRALFQKHQFDVVHVHEPTMPMLPYWAVMFSWRAAHVGTFHAFSEAPNPLVLNLNRMFTPIQQPAFQVSMAVSEAAAAYAGLTWRKPLTIVPNGVPTEIFRPPVGRRAPGPVRLLFVGCLSDSRKGFVQLYETFIRLRARGLDITLDVVGESSGVPRPPPTAGLTYHGPVSMRRLVQHYQHCDIFVAPSLGQESFGIVLIEAMASGRPIICSDIEGYRHTVSLEGARLVPPHDVGALERAIAGLAGRPDLWPHMGEVNRQRAAVFAWDSVADRVRHLYHRAIESRAESRSSTKVVALPPLGEARPAAQTDSVWARGR